MTKKIHSLVLKNGGDLENFETIQHTQKIDTLHFASFKTIQLLYETIFH